jgi:DNA replication and repair protein RecF
VRINAFDCRGFRNLADAESSIGPGLTVLHGPNGAGKTNILDALYFGLTSHSFRTGPARDVISFDQRSARVELELDTGAARRPRLLAGIDRAGERRHLLDGRPLDRADERPLVSVFHPDRLQLLKGPPAHRRAHLDRFVGALRPARGELRSSYGRTLSQRNAQVARVRGGQAPPQSLAVWDERLGAEAEPLIASRREAVEAISAPFASRADQLGLPDATIAYRPRTEAGASAIVAELERLRDDLGRSYLTFGPQLDELELRAGDRKLRRFGSQGEQRIALLALLFAERDALGAEGRPSPVMLLDDVMSELDPERRGLLTDALGGAGQTLITATEASQVPEADGALVVAIRAGAVRSGLAAAA